MRIGILTGPGHGVPGIQGGDGDGVGAGVGAGVGDGVGADVGERVGDGEGEEEADGSAPCPRAPQAARSAMAARQSQRAAPEPARPIER